MLSDQPYKAAPVLTLRKPESVAYFVAKSCLIAQSHARVFCANFVQCSPSLADFTGCCSCVRPVVRVFLGRFFSKERIL